MAAATNGDRQNEATSGFGPWRQIFADRSIVKPTLAAPGSADAIADAVRLALVHRGVRPSPRSRCAGSGNLPKSHWPRRDSGRGWRPRTEVFARALIAELDERCFGVERASYRVEDASRQAGAPLAALARDLDTVELEAKTRDERLVQSGHLMELPIRNPPAAIPCTMPRSVVGGVLTACRIRSAKPWLMVFASLRLKRKTNSSR